MTEAPTCIFGFPSCLLPFSPVKPPHLTIQNHEAPPPQSSSFGAFPFLFLILVFSCARDNVEQGVIASLIDTRVFLSAPAASVVLRFTTPRAVESTLAHEKRKNLTLFAVHYHQGHINETEMECGVDGTRKVLYSSESQEPCRENSDKRKQVPSRRLNAFSGGGTPPVRGPPGVVWEDNGQALRPWGFFSSSVYRLLVRVSASAPCLDQRCSSITHVSCNPGLNGSEDSRS